MITATSSPDRFGSLLRGLLKKNISNMVYLALIGFIGIPLPYLLAMESRLFMHNIRFSFVLNRQAVRLPCSQSLG